MIKGLANGAVINLADHRITIDGQDFPWLISEEGFAVETRIEEFGSTPALRLLHLRVAITGDVVVEGDPSHQEEGDV